VALLSLSARRGLIVLTAVAALIVTSPHSSRAAQQKRTPSAKGVTKKPAVKGTAKKTTAEAAGVALLEFCGEWMHKLQVREHDNLEHIKWDTGPDGVQGTYTGYSQDHTCKITEGTETDPVAKILYREVRYKKHGSTVAEAEQSTPEPIEIFDVQEIFHYLKAKGKWDY
jgi:hypothetical protein